MNEKIELFEAKEHNLQIPYLEIPKNKLVVITGPSGSGKSSLAFDTIYAEGQRRYLESLSSYARQFLNIHEKPDFGEIRGLAPTIAINQKTTSNNPRSTVGTITEIYDYMRLLFARIGRLYSPSTGEEIKKQTTSQIIESLMDFPRQTKVNLLSPLVIHQKGEHQKVFEKIKRGGFQRVRIDSIIYELEEIPELEKNKFHDIEAVVDRFEISDDDSTRIASSVEACSRLSDGLVYLEILEMSENGRRQSGYEEGQIIKFSEKFVCIESGFSIPEIEPRSFSFNNTNSACGKCEGIGSIFAIDPDLILASKSATISETLKLLIPNKYLLEEISTKISGLLEKTPFFLDSPWYEVSEEIRDFLFYGPSVFARKINQKDYISELLSKKILFNGLIDFLEKASSYYGMNYIKNFQSEIKCPACKGFRLGKDILNVKINGLHIGEVSELTISDAFQWFSQLPECLREEEKKISEKIIKEIIARLQFLMNVGLDYLLISRKAGSLSGGENQRIRLASQIGSALSGVIYVLDEPSIGLHQSDNDKLIETLKKLRDLGNSVLVVEHDEDTMRSADYLIDMGPGAGKFGGQVISVGTPEKVALDPKSLTGCYLSGREKIEVPSRRREFDHNRKIVLKGASANNLKNIDAEFPLGLMTCVTGVSGSGKSTLVFDTLQEILRRKFGLVNSRPGEYAEVFGLEQIDKFIEIDQSPIGRTPRSNPATYTGVFDLIRALFASLPESKARGYTVGRFSFNVEGGRCEVCSGDGYKKIEMHFLPDVFIPCEVCGSKRYNKETLEILYKGKNIADILGMSIQDNLEFFEKKSGVREKLQTLVDVGLGYLTLGQSVTTISGGESQRIKLAKELSKRSTGKTLYFLDEPTTGLHSHDIKNLLGVLERLLENGNTIVVIEHNLDVIKCADYIIDIGPGGGKAGGEVVAKGTPEDVAKDERSLTGRYLRRYLNI